MSDRWLRYLEFWRRDPRRDVDDEIAFHLEERVADLVARGMTADDARRRATAEFGTHARCATRPFASTNGCCVAAPAPNGGATFGVTHASVFDRCDAHRASRSRP